MPNERKNKSIGVKPLSYSEMQLFWEDQDAWYKKYIIGIVPPPTYAMTRGKDIHAMCLEGGKVALDELAYFPREVRVHQTIKDEFEKALQGRRKEFQFEEEVKCLIGGVPTIGFWDGFHPADEEILELKTGAGLWTGLQAKEHGQGHFYALQYFKKTEKFPNMRWVTASTNNGSLRAYYFQYTADEIGYMQDLIEATWEEMGKYRLVRKSTKNI